ncbi:MAG: phosphate-starvation-inducible PsiE family protein [Mariprofundaceae bacterium]|nr:phosphate-starvation-inducible PsiE family protein [Mariprofundaceae bacterium]
MDTEKHRKTHIEWTLEILNWTGHFARLIVSLALVLATILIAIAFFHDVYLAVMKNPFITGFIHAIGALLLLWTMVELINMEKRLLHEGSVDISVFIEVALVVMVREVILLPVREPHASWIDVAMWTGAATLLGLTFFLVRQGQRWKQTRK